LQIKIKDVVICTYKLGYTIGVKKNEKGKIKNISLIYTKNKKYISDLYKVLRIKGNEI